MNSALNVMAQSLQNVQLEMKITDIPSCIQILEGTFSAQPLHFMMKFKGNEETVVQNVKIVMVNYLIIALIAQGQCF